MIIDHFFTWTIIIIKCRKCFFKNFLSPSKPPKQSEISPFSPLQLLATPKPPANNNHGRLDSTSSTKGAYLANYKEYPSKLWQDLTPADKKAAKSCTRFGPKIGAGRKTNLVDGERVELSIESKRVKELFKG